MYRYAKMKTRPPLGAKVVLSGDETFASIEIYDVDGILAYIYIVPECAQDGLLFQVYDVKAAHGYGPLMYAGLDGPGLVRSSMAPA